MGVSAWAGGLAGGLAGGRAATAGRRRRGRV